MANPKEAVPPHSETKVQEEATVKIPGGTPLHGQGAPSDEQLKQAAKEDPYIPGQVKIKGQEDPQKPITGIPEQKGE